MLLWLPRLLLRPMDDSRRLLVHPANWCCFCGRNRRVPRAPELAADEDEDANVSGEAGVIKRPTLEDDEAREAEPLEHRARA